MDARVCLHNTDYSTGRDFTSSKELRGQVYPCGAHTAFSLANSQIPGAPIPTKGGGGMGPQRGGVGRIALSDDPACRDAIAFTLRYASFVATERWLPGDVLAAPEA